MPTASSSPLGAALARGRHVFSRKKWKNLYVGKFARALTRTFGAGAGSRLLLGEVDFSGAVHDGEPVVLCLERPLFAKDLAELRAHTRLNYLVLSQSAFYSVQKAWLPRALQDQVRYVVHEAAHRRERRLVDALCERFLRDLMRRSRLDAVLSSNLDYAQDASMKNACRRLGLPFLVLCKENHSTAHNRRLARENYESVGYTFTGEAAAVFSESQRDLFLATGACRPEQLWVTGSPRFDAWRCVDLDAFRREHYVLLSFIAPGYGARDEFVEVLDAFAAASLRQAEGRFVVKCKFGRDQQEIAALLAARPHRLELVVDEPLYTLFPAARLIVGFNTLAMLEALHTRARLVVPHFGAIPQAPDNLMLDPADAQVRAAFHFAESAEALAAHLEAAMQGREEAVDVAQRHALFSRHFYLPPEGPSSAAVERFIRHYAGRRAPAPAPAPAEALP